MFFWYYLPEHQARKKEKLHEEEGYTDKYIQKHALERGAGDNFRIEISVNKTLAALAILGTTVLSTWWLIFLRLEDDSAVMFIVFLLCIPWMIFTAVLFRQFFVRDYRLIVDNNGITDNVSNMGLIPWSDIKDLKLVYVPKTGKKLAVFLHDPVPDKYIMRSKGFWSQRRRKSINKHYGTPIIIGFGFLEHKGVDLLYILKRELAKRSKAA